MKWQPPSGAGVPMGIKYSVSNLKLPLKPDPGLLPALNSSTNRGPSVLTRKEEKVAYLDEKLKHSPFLSAEISERTFIQSYTFIRYLRV